MASSARAGANAPLRTLLVCHHDAPVHVEGISRWLASWSDLAGLVVIREPRSALRRRVRREWRRVGSFRLLDVFAMRLYYRLVTARRDSEWLQAEHERLIRVYPVRLDQVPRIEVSSPNSRESQAFIRSARPDMVIGLCKTILAERIFGIPRYGTFVMHPGICPEYRNAHGCFWALASNDAERVGLSLIRIDKGVDTGPIFGYFRVPIDEPRESHVRIQHRVLLENLPGLEEHLKEIAAGSVHPVDITGRASREWGQPWLSAYLRWKWRTRRGRARHSA